MDFELDYDQMLILDAEDLAEGGIGEAYESLLPRLRQYVAQPAKVEEDLDSDAPRYAVRFGAKEFVISGPDDPDEEQWQSWGKATHALFTIVNDQLDGSDYRFFAINAGNDLGGMFLTPAQAQASRKTLHTRNDWPYLPNNEPPWYGQYH